MLQNSVAARYAQAFFDIAGEDELIDEYGQELTKVSDALSMNPEFFRLIHHPSLTNVQKKELVGKILTACSLSKPTHEFLLVLERRKRIDLIQEIALLYLRMADKQKNIITVIVTSAIPLSTAQQDALKNKLSQMLSSVIKLKMQVSHKIIGGLIIRLKDKVIDGSVCGRLDRLKAEIGRG
ncbi:ATP synthase F1 subunit delta [Candidatus Desantisbacteria bacterium]|nr:ATP synthase F1 subunit delta [Candidatus Desantisbacteria bacterium]